MNRGGIASSLGSKTCCSHATTFKFEFEFEHLSICMSMFAPDSPPFLVMSTACSTMHLLYLAPSLVCKHMWPIDHRHVVLCAWGHKRCNNLCTPIQLSGSRIAMCVPSYSTANRD